MDLDSEEHGLWNGYGFGFKSIRTHCSHLIILYHLIITSISAQRNSHKILVENTEHATNQ